MKIAILHPSYEESESPFKQLDPVCDPARFLPEFDCTNFHLHKRTSVRQVAEIAREGFDVAFNLCDGAWEEDRPGIEVVQALERLNVAFTGAGSLFYEPTRIAMKMACESVGVAFPACFVARGEADAAEVSATLRFPMIVKHPNSYASVGLTPDSRVTDEAGLRRELARMTGEYGSALVEEFIDGREFTVLVTEPREGQEDPWTFTPVEFRFPPGTLFKDFDTKWVRYAEIEDLLVRDVDLAGRLREAAALTFAALGGSGFGRCDLRMDAAGVIHMLEINPNCEIFCPDGEFGSADLVLAQDPAGHAGFARHLVMCALRRQARAARPWEIRYRRESGFGLCATRAIRAGELVERYEEQAFTLVSQGHVRRHWNGMKSSWFERYAWPLHDDVYAIWSADPEAWRPVNHSCDPNVWLEGLDLVARRDIVPGEALCMDYATFYGPAMASFECACRTAVCRGIVRGTDYRLPALRQRYGAHMSPFLRSQPMVEALRSDSSSLTAARVEAGRARRDGRGRRQ
jgi:D-alanine-D-alanine ligase-like ATP-grasp enzyme